ncbi:MAG: hypothetical protein ACK55I_14320, partial [bacterium]
MLPKVSRRYCRPGSGSRSAAVVSRMANSRCRSGERPKAWSPAVARPRPRAVPRGNPLSWE